MARVALALIERRRRYLICKRIAGTFLGGYWEFPGGKRQLGESWKACVRREVREELGVTVRSLRLVGRMQHRYGQHPTIFRVYRCAIAGRPRRLAAQAMRWVNARQLSRYRFPPANRALLERLRDNG